MIEAKKKLRYSLPLRIGICFAVIGLFKFYCSLGFTVEQNTGLAEHLKNALTVYLLEFIIYFVIIALIFLRLNQKNGKLDQINKPNDLGFTPNILFGLLIISRVAWWASPTSPSEDVWRYLWDGERYINGQYIYLIAPSDVKLGNETINDQISREILSRIGHAEIPTVYPPSAQLTFALSIRISGNLENYLFNGPLKLHSKPEQVQTALRLRLTIWRFLILCIDLALLSVLISIIRLGESSKAILVIYALSPMIAFESSLGAHLDLLGIFFMLFSFNLFVREKYFVAGCMLGIGFLIKFIPFIVLLTLILVWVRNILFSKKKKITYLQIKLECIKLGLCGLGFCLGSLFVSLPLVSELWQLEGLWPGLKTYSAHWSFNGSVYPLTESLILKYFQSYDWESSRLLLKVFLGLLTAFMGLLYTIKVNGNTSEKYIQLAQINLFILSVLFFFSPVVFTWYLQWVFPFIVLVINPSKFRRGLKHAESLKCILLLLWCFSSNLTYIPRYAILSGKVWKFDVFWTILEYGILVLTLLIIKGYSLYYSHEVSSNK